MQQYGLKHWIGAWALQNLLPRHKEQLVPPFEPPPWFLLGDKW